MKSFELAAFIIFKLLSKLTFFEVENDQAAVILGVGFSEDVVSLPLVSCGFRVEGAAHPSRNSVHHILVYYVTGQFAQIIH